MSTETHPSTTANRPRPPVGWPEMVLGLVGFFAVGHTVAGLFGLLETDPVVTGVVLSSLAGVATLAAFALAVGVRIRRLGPFGLTRTTPRWLLVGAAGGALLFLLRGLISTPLIELFGLETDVQSDLVGGAQGGVWALVLTGVGIAVLGPVGEELLFRGVVQTGLLRYGAVISTLGSATVFALVHGGLSILTPLSFLFGLLAAELYRRSGSLWPAVVAHVVHNAPTPFLYALLL